MILDIDAITEAFTIDPRVILVTLFGSSQNGTVNDGSDVDIGVLLYPEQTPLEFYKFYQNISTRLSSIAKLDLIDLGHANSILAFEALCGRRLFVRDNEAVAAFSSLVARQYEDDLLHTTGKTSHLAIQKRRK
jgi:predicted nucleotidyltransferase